VVVENHGVSGDTTAGGLARIGWALGDHVDALIVALGGNDLLRGLPPEASRANLDGILAEAEARGPARPPDRAGGAGELRTRVQGGLRRDVPDLADAYGALHVESFLAPLTEAAERSGGGACPLHAARRSSTRMRRASR
jgi:acyl-CoA thioesterase-1